MKKIIISIGIILTFSLTACGDPENSQDPYSKKFDQSKQLKQQIDQLPNSEDRICKTNPETC